MNIYLMFFLIAIAAYLLGSINFARILAWHSRRKDITKVGSGNPGTMNMLRSFGFLPALITLILEVVKAGVCCLVTKIIVEHTQFPAYSEFAYYFAGLFAVIGSVFPIFYGFKGGKGLACFAGVLWFTPLWWVAFIVFLVFAILLYFYYYAFISTLSFITCMSASLTAWVFVEKIPFAWAIVVILWCLTAFIYLRHSGNFIRFVRHQENKSGFRKSIVKIFHRQKGVEEIPEEHVQQPPEKEIIIEDDQEN